MGLTPPVEPSASAFFVDSPAFSLTSVAKALISDNRLHGVHVVTRPPDLLGVFDVKTRSQSSLLAGFETQCIEQLPTTKVLSWTDVEAAVRQLAETIRRSLDGNQMHAAVLVGIPRGGLIVAGLVAYELGWPSDRVQNPATDRPKIVIDDVIISGSRMGQVLGDGTSTLLAGALHSTASAAHALEEATGVPIRFAEELPERPPTSVDPEAWAERWANRSPVGVVTNPHHLILPWKEPDWTWWDPATKSEQPGIRFLSESPAGIASAASARCTRIDEDFPYIPEDLIWRWSATHIDILRRTSDTTEHFSLPGPAGMVFEAAGRDASLAGAVVDQLKARNLLR